MDRFSAYRKSNTVVACILGSLSFILFLLFQAQGIFGGDSGDLVTAAVTRGVAHPPGYPLYTLFGWIVSHIPLSTPTWRIGLLSSLPHAVVIALVYVIVTSHTKRTLLGLFSALLLIGNYVFFLYSVTPEVFGLFDLFVVVLVYLLINRYSLSLTAFVFGLSLTHHHVILFLLPAVAYWLWKNKIRLRLSSLVWFFAGLLPYTYVLIAAHGQSMINWDRPVNMAGFLRLITRSDYGTFISGGGFGTLIIQRFLQLQAYAQLVLLDYTWIGIILLLVGVYSLWKRDRRLCLFMLLAVFFLGPVFFFYASFPLINRFFLGTYERFLLPSYVLFAVISGIGLSELANRIKAVVRPAMSRLVLGLGYLVILLYPLSQLGMTVWRFYGLPGDRTADNIGKDILSPLPADSILLLSHDTPLFTTQYVRYTLLYRPDIIVIHTSRLDFPDYQETLHSLFPDITFSASGHALMNLVTAQHVKKRIFSNTPQNVGAGWYWVPYGLTYELVDKEHQPSATAMYQDNLAIWKSLHDPTMGILARYNHLMLSDVRDVYAGSHIALGTALLRAGMLDEAYGQFRAAEGIAGDTELANAFMYEGLTRLFQKKCTDALTAFESAKKSSIVINPPVLYYEATTYRDCVGDQKRAQELFDAYAASRGNTQTPLEKL